MRYMLFIGDDYYPAGGMGDFSCEGDDLSILKGQALGIYEMSWAHIYDTIEKKVVFCTRRPGRKKAVETSCKDVIQ